MSDRPPVEQSVGANLDELRRLLDSTAPGPWKIDQSPDGDRSARSANGYWITETSLYVGDNPQDEDGSRHLAFIVAMRNALPYLLECAADAERLDWLEANAMRENDEDAGGVRVERFAGSPEKQFEDACFRARRWGPVPFDDEGNPDYMRRFYGPGADHRTLREAIDAARSPDTSKGGRP